jgi:hypothetical protein
VPPTRPGIAPAAITRLVPKRNVLIRKDPHQDYHRQIGESDNQYLHRDGIQQSPSLGDYPFESRTVQSGYNSGVDKMAGYLSEPKNRTFLRQNKKRCNNQIPRDSSQIANQRA